MTKVTSTITSGCQKPQSDLDDWQKEATGWTVELAYQGRTMTLDYFTGSAVAEITTADVLSCVLVDVQCLDEGFENWAAELDYDNDSRRAERVYNALKAQSAKLATMLGDDFESFLTLDEDEIEERAA